MNLNKTIMADNDQILCRKVYFSLKLDWWQLKHVWNLMCTIYCFFMHSYTWTYCLCKLLHILSQCISSIADGGYLSIKTTITWGLILKKSFNYHLYPPLGYILILLVDFFFMYYRFSLDDSISLICCLVTVPFWLLVNKLMQKSISSRT